MPVAAPAQKCSDSDQAIALVYKTGGYTLKEIGEHFGVHYSRVSRIVAMRREGVIRQMAKDKTLPRASTGGPERSGCREPRLHEGGSMSICIRILLGFITLAVLTGCEKARLDEQVKELCAKDGGIKVYEAVTLPQKRFGANGDVELSPKQQVKPGDEFYFERETSHLRTGNPEILRSLHQIVRVSDGKTLGTSITYMRRGGDAPGPWHESSFTCPEPGSLIGLERQVFLKGE